MDRLAWILCALLLCAAVVQSFRLQVEEDEHALTRAELAAAQKKIADCKAEAEYRHIQTGAQAALGAACLARERAGLDDAALRDDIMHKSAPAPITPEQAQQGVGHETRRAAAEYLNRPL